MKKFKRFIRIIAVVIIVSVLSSLIVIPVAAEAGPLYVKGSHIGSGANFEKGSIPDEATNTDLIPKITPNNETELLFWHFIVNGTDATYIKVKFNTGDSITDFYVIQTYKDNGKTQHFGIFTPVDWTLSDGIVCDENGLNINVEGGNFNLSHVALFIDYNTTTTTTTGEPTTTTTTTTTTTGETTTTTGEPTTTTTTTTTTTGETTTTTGEPTTTTTTTTTTTGETTTTTGEPTTTTKEEPTTTTTTTTTTTEEPTGTTTSTTTTTEEPTGTTTTTTATTEEPTSTTTSTTTTTEEPATTTTTVEIPLVLQELVDQVIPLDNGLFAVDAGDGLFEIFDDAGVPLGYVQLKDNENIEEYDVVENLIPLAGLNPKTGDSTPIFIIMILLAVCVMVVSRKKLFKS